MAIVEEQGVDALTVAGLARRADAAVGGLYRYFDGKQAVIAGLQRRAARRFGEWQAARIADADARTAALTDGQRALARVWAAVAAWRSFAAADPVLFRLINSALSAPDPVFSDALALELEEEVQVLLGAVQTALTASVQARVLADGDSLLRAYTLWAGMHGIGHLRKRDRFSPPAVHAHRIEASLLHTLLLGWGAPDADADAARDALA